MARQSLRDLVRTGEVSSDYDHSADDGNESLLRKEKSTASYTVDAAIDKVGFCRLQVNVIVFVTVALLYAGARLPWLVLYTKYSHCTFGISGWEVALVSQAFFFGRLICGPLMGTFIDTFGRKKTMTVITLFGGYFHALSSVAPTYSWLTILSLIQGFFYAPICGASLSYCAEFQPSRYRKALSVGVQSAMFFGGSITILLCLLAFELGWSWRIANFLSTLLVPPIALLSMYVPESPHYNISRGKIAEVEALLKSMASQHRVRLPPGHLVQSRNIVQQLNEHRGSSWKLLVTPWKMLFVTVVNLVIRFMSSFSYQGFYFFTAAVSTQLNKKVQSCPPFGSSDYLYMIWSMSAEAFGAVAGVIVTSLWQQRLGFFTLGVGVTIPLGLLLLPASKLTITQSIALVFIARMFSVALSQMSYAYVAEFFPSVARGKAFGLFVVSASLGASLVPYVGAVLAIENLFAVKLVFLAAACIDAICSVSLPNVSSKKLEDTLFTSDGKRS